MLYSFHDDDDGDNDDDNNDDDYHSKTIAHQDYVDENLAAFQAQITQLQGEYWHSCFPPVFTFSASVFSSFCPLFASVL